MSDQSQEQNAPIELKPHHPKPGTETAEITMRGTARKTKRYGARTRIRDKDFCRTVIVLALDGYTVKGIAKQLHTAQDTVRYILDAARIEEKRKQAIEEMGRSILDIQQMVATDVVAKRDRRLGHEILRETGVYAETNPNAPKQGPGEDKHITFEFNFAPPPWAPPAVRAAYDEKRKLLESIPAAPDTEDAKT